MSVTMEKRVSGWKVAACLVVATALWLPCVHWFFGAREAEFHALAGIPPKARAMAERQIRFWRNQGARDRELKSMRGSNSEWDFMGRTFLVMSFGEMCLREPALKGELLPIMDRIIGETVRLEAEHGMHYFLMPYSKSRPYLVAPARSLFIDGEIAVMIGARRMVEEKQEFKAEFGARVGAMRERLENSSELALESYPNECWMFDHAMAMVAFRMADLLDRTSLGALSQRWLAKVRAGLVHKETGLLVSSYTTDVRPLDGPEGSSIWLTAYCLRLLDEPFAREQYRRARGELGRTLAGFGWSREWPSSWAGAKDIDSGAVIPILEVSAGGSGLALIAAASFGDHSFLESLHRTLDFAAFPVREGGALRYSASNQVGDCVLLYSMVLGPMWERLQEAKL